MVSKLRTSKALSLLPIILLILPGVIAANYYTVDPSTCPQTDATNFPGQNCNPLSICGSISGIAQCYDTSLLTFPGVAASSETLYSGSYGGGFIFDCYANSGVAPYCNVANCNRNSGCYGVGRMTDCTPGAWTTFTCGSCRPGYQACDGDINDADGCEVHDGDACSVGGVAGVISGCNGTVGNCVLTPIHFITGIEATYNSTTPNLWGHQLGTGPLMNLTNASGSSFIINPTGCIVWPDGDVQCNSTTITSGVYVPYTGAINNVNLASNNITAGQGSRFGNSNQYYTFGIFDVESLIPGLGYFKTIKGVTDSPLGNGTVIENSLAILGGTEVYGSSLNSFPSIALLNSSDLNILTLVYNLTSNQLQIDRTVKIINAGLNVTSGYDVCIDGGNCLSTTNGGNTSWNQSLANSLYYEIASDNTTLLNMVNASGLIINWSNVIITTGDNSSWNQTLGNSLYLKRNGDNTTGNYNITGNIYATAFCYQNGTCISVGGLTESDPVWLAAKSSYNTTLELDTHYLIISDQRYNDTTAINLKLNISDQRYNDTAAINLKLNISDQRYNESARITIINNSKTPTFTCPSGQFATNSTSTNVSCAASVFYGLLNNSDYVNFSRMTLGSAKVMEPGSMNMSGQLIVGGNATLKGIISNGLCRIDGSSSTNLCLGSSTQVGLRSAIIGSNSIYDSILNGNVVVITGNYSTIGNGYDQSLSSSYSFIGSGYGNQIIGSNLTTNRHINSILVSELSSIIGDHNTITGGNANQISGSYNMIDQGKAGYISGNFSTIINGETNTIGMQGKNTYSVILSGRGNTINASHSIILDGENNTILGNYSGVFGSNIVLTENNKFVFGSDVDVQGALDVNRASLGTAITGTGLIGVAGYTGVSTATGALGFASAGVYGSQGTGTYAGQFVGDVSVSNKFITVASPISPCNSSIEGAVYYNSTTHKHYGCNGSSWNALY